MMSLTTTRKAGRMNQMMPSKMLDTKKEVGMTTTRMIMCVHAYWLNWYMYSRRLRLSTKATKPAAAVVVVVCWHQHAGSALHCVGAACAHACHPAHTWLVVVVVVVVVVGGVGWGGAGGVRLQHMQRP